MTKTTQETKSAIWKRLFVEHANPRAFAVDPRPIFLVCSAIALAAGVAGWTLASVFTSWLVPVCSAISILGGLIGMRSKLRTVSLIAFVMGMFLLPHAVNTVILLVRAAAGSS